jgi:hypothetical protein
MNCVSSFNNVIKYGIPNSPLYPTDFRYSLPFDNSLVALTNGTTYSNVSARTSLTMTTTPSYGTSIKGSGSLLIDRNYYLTLPPEICTGLNEGCISVWVNLNDARKTTIFGLQVDGSNSYGFLTIGSYNGGGGSGIDGVNMKVYFRCNNQGQLYTASNTLATNTWYHIVVNWNRTSNVGNMYINNSLVFTTPSLNANDFLTYTSGSPGCLIGTWIRANGLSATTGQVFSGKIDEFKLFSRNLSVAEINELYTKK